MRPVVGAAMRVVRKANHWRSPLPSRARSLLLTLAAYGLGLAACGGGTDGNGQRSTELRAASAFSRVESRGSLDVQIDQGAAFGVVVSIDSNLQRMVTTRVAGSTLVIDVDGSIGETVPGPHVLVTLPVLELAALTGSGSITGSAFQQDQAVALAIDGSGDVAFTGTVPSVEGRLGGSGELRISGAAALVDLSLDGSGKIDAIDCSGIDAVVSLSGSGRIATTATRSAQVRLSGSGNIDLYGGATITSESVSGSGDVRAH
jgi:hypothetical protein